MGVERYPGHWTVRQARDAYLAENGFTEAAYDDAFTEAVVSVLGRKLKVLIPNTPSHRRALMLHDLHHAITGYGTDVAGEGEISAWELRAGLGGLGLYVSSIVGLGVVAGLLRAPRRTWRAWTRGEGARTLFDDARSYEWLLDQTLAELRRSLGVPDEGLSEGGRGLHAAAPA